MEILHILEEFVPYLAGVIEALGILIILYGVFSSVIIFFRSKLDLNSMHTLLNLAQSLSLALEFMLAAEILKSIIIVTYEELIRLAVIMILRLVMTYVLHWEIKASHEEDEMVYYTKAEGLEDRNRFPVPDLQERHKKDNKDSDEE